MSGFNESSMKRLTRRLGLRFRRLIRYEQDLRIPVPCPKARVPLTFREVTEEDLRGSTRFIDPQSLPELAARLRQGQFAVGAFHEGRLTAFRWLNPLEGHEITTGIRFPLAPGEIYSYQKLVDPALRNLGVGAHLGWEGNRMTVEKGYFKKISFIDARNHANQRSTSKNRNLPVAQLLFIQVFGLRLQMTFPLKTTRAERRAEAAAERAADL